MDKLLQIVDAEVIRQKLNIEASKILGRGTQDSYSLYEKFCDDYDQAIHRAWYIPRNVEKTTTTLLGYKLIRQIAAGGFGTVFEAETSNGKPVAIKLLHEAVRSDPQHLQSFRRGVRSIKLLTESNVPCVVKFIGASEIPALVVMELIPGPTLHEKILQLGHKATWQLLLRIAVIMSRTLSKSHQLPQQVLHRDFRPKNIMFREYWDGDDDWDIVVLDFDLSWHKDSEEKSMSLESYSGYLAPEQVETNSKYSTRNGLVDSYGLGMSLYYTRTRIDPTFSQPATALWDEHLLDSARVYLCKEWVSLPKRFFRLISNCTRIEQPMRWDLVQADSELARLQEAINSPLNVRSAELLAEEIAARAFPDQYFWDPDKLAAVRQITSDSTVSVIGDESDREVKLFARWIDNGTLRYANRKQWLDSVTTSSRATLESAGWTHIQIYNNNRSLEIHASIGVEIVASTIAQTAIAVAKINESLIHD